MHLALFVKKKKIYAYCFFQLEDQAAGPVRRGEALRGSRGTRVGTQSVGHTAMERKLESSGATVLWPKWGE